MATVLKRQDKQQSYVIVNPPVEDTPVDLASLPEDLHLKRELSYARAKANEFQTWLAFHIAAERIPLDNVSRPVWLLNQLVLAWLVAKAKYPHLFWAPEPEETWTPQDEADAIDAGLTIRRVRRGDARPPANLTGCAGENGHCTLLRRYGERFCAKCRRAELARLRG